MYLLSPTETAVGLRVSANPSDIFASDSRAREAMRSARLLVGDVGWWVLILLGLCIHLATVWIAFNAHEGLRAWVVATLSAVVPAIPEIYWGLFVAAREGTVMHPYVLTIIGYPVACGLFLLGGWLFFPDRGGDRVDATEGAEQ